jgi:putative membrane protein insertion efficiency factor
VVREGAPRRKQHREHLDPWLGDPRTRQPQALLRAVSIGLRRMHHHARYWSTGRSLVQHGCILTRVSWAPMKWILLQLVRGYQLLLSPFFGRQCRFYPTCSEYAREAIDRHGSLKGSWLAVLRIVRCGPWHPGGVDPVPPKAR